MPKKRAKTRDIEAEEGLSFSDLLLPEPILRGLQAAGFESPSPIQLKAIPVARMGTDLIAQAKSGTGKTCVFTVVALEVVDCTKLFPQVVILAPTREIAQQISEVLETVGRFIDGLSVGCFIGGTAFKDDCKRVKSAQIVVGTPGRLLSLLEAGAMRSDSVRLAVVDEADQLLEGTFQKDVSTILNFFPVRRQTLIFSATFLEKTVAKAQRFMRNPQQIRISADSLSLQGVRQFFARVNPEESSQVDSEFLFELKVKTLVHVLSVLPFHQCVVFSNNRDKAFDIVRVLELNGWPCACISSDFQQHERSKALLSVRKFKVRVLVSTDLTARGVDLSSISLVVNLDLPGSYRTYLHRVGRTGRFGTYGVAITFVCGGSEEEVQLQRFAKHLSTSIDLLEDAAAIPADFLVSADELTDRERQQLEELKTFTPSRRSKKQKVRSRPQQPNCLCQQLPPHCCVAGIEAAAEKAAVNWLSCGSILLP